MRIEEPRELVNRIAAATACEPEQVFEVVRLAFQALHKTAFCDEKNVTAALMQCCWAFGDEACFHLSGLLEEARVGTDHELPWSEFMARFLPDAQRQLSPIIDEWQNDKTEDRRAFDNIG
ncbi:MAG: hypothetical protein ACRD5K_04275 [Candidatus Acidiferrales bacterium]